MGMDFEDWYMNTLATELKFRRDADLDNCHTEELSCSLIREFVEEVQNI
jgi:hypothetical protein